MNEVRRGSVRYAVVLSLLQSADACIQGCVEQWWLFTVVLAHVMEQRMGVRWWSMLLLFEQPCNVDMLGHECMCVGSYACHPMAIFSQVDAQMSAC